ncbi:MAG: sigma-54-dependent Fis family transcriptional regulator [Bacteroidetes bacterium]|nr:MAG: sigma-54-dependent Fis family transcriptional regulator [Bacteroidota bacterium]
MFKVLIVDDDVGFCNMLKSYLTRKGFQVDEAFSYQEAIKLLSDRRYDAILSDFRLPDKSGFELLKDITTKTPDSLVIIMTAYADIRMAVKAIKLGAYEYVTKPVNPDEIYLFLKNGLKTSVISSGPPSLKSSNDNKSTKVLEYVFANSPESLAIHKYIDLVAPTDMSVIIQGESGTGKEYIARKIHAQSNRHDFPFVAIDCGALSKELAGSEFFGHIKGSFTGALNDKIGQFEVANGGTLFLDEIGNLSYEVQVKLLRAIQERKIKKIGSNKDISVNVRIITASNEDLAKAVKNGSFREDLYHRLNEFSVLVPPLRERKEDIVVFAEFFLKKANEELGRSVNSIPDDIMDHFYRYTWPGNIREVKNVIRRAVLLSIDDKITVESLPHEIIFSDFLKQDMLTANNHDLKSHTGHTEKEVIISTLEKAKFNKSKAARILNIDRKTLYNKIKQYGISLD